MDTPIPNLKLVFILAGQVFPPHRPLRISQIPLISCSQTRQLITTGLTFSYLATGGVTIEPVGGGGFNMDQ